MDVILRLEEEKDFREVENLTREAFWNLNAPGCDEHALVHQMRKHPDFIPALDWIAISGEKIVGHIAYTAAQLESEGGLKISTAMLGPLSVLPGYQRKGIGSLLIQKTVSRATALGYAAIALWGNPANYVKHGFKNCQDFRVSISEEMFPTCLLVLELKKDLLGKEFCLLKESDVFSMNPEETAAFEATFPPKEKRDQYTQELFRILSRSRVG